MERELNKLFNDTNYNKENVIIREIWSINLNFQTFFEEFIIKASYDTFAKSNMKWQFMVVNYETVEFIDIATFN